MASISLCVTFHSLPGMKEKCILRKFVVQWKVRNKGRQDEKILCHVFMRLISIHMHWMEIFRKRLKGGETVCRFRCYSVSHQQLIDRREFEYFVAAGSSEQSHLSNYFSASNQLKIKSLSNSSTQTHNSRNDNELTSSLLSICLSTCLELIAKQISVECRGKRSELKLDGFMKYEIVLFRRWDNGDGNSIPFTIKTVNSLGFFFSSQCFGFIWAQF